jgi:glycosyltransferase involved in cell wall biosynthesis
MRRMAVDAIFSTYPIATAHLIGHSLARGSGLPWIADFRDPMAQDGYPEDPRTWSSFKRIEERVFAVATSCTFTTEGAARLYRERYPDTRADIEIIENGYDEVAFSEAPDAPLDTPLNSGALTVLHSGIVYPDERDPTQLFAALAQLKSRGVDGARLRVRFRAPVHEAMLATLAKLHAVEDMIEIMPSLAYREALGEMLRADALLVLQAANCNAQVPAKLYEYLRARRPLIALTDPAGDTAGVLRRSGIGRIARLDSETEIRNILLAFATGYRRGLLATESAIADASRLERTRQLALVLDRGRIVRGPQTDRAAGKAIDMMAGS